MKRFISGLVALAAAGAAIGAAGYYLYKKNQMPDEGEEMLYTEEMGDEFIIIEDDEETVEAVAEDMAETVEDAFAEVKEALDGAEE